MHLNPRPTLLIAAFLLSFSSSATAQVLPTAVFPVDSYSATPNNPNDDDRQPIQDAVDAATNFASATGGTAVVTFSPSAAYHLSSNYQNTSGNVQLNGRGIVVGSTGNGSVTLDGKGAKLVTTEQGIDTIFVYFAERVTISDLDFDAFPLPYVVGTIASITGQDVIIDIEEGISDPTVFTAANAAGLNNWGWFLDPVVPGRPRRGSSSVVKCSAFAPVVSNPSQMKFTVTGSAAAPGFAVGSRFTYHFRDGHNIAFASAHDLTLEDITSHGGGHFYIWGVNSNDVTIRRCDVRIAQGRWRAHNGDGMHLEHMNNLTIDNCYIEGISDDAIHIKDSEDYSITGCTFTNKRRHGILLDGDGNLGQSKRGTITGNTASFNGGTFFHQLGADYPNTLVAGNTTFANNYAISGDTTFLVEIRPLLNNGTALGAGAGLVAPVAGDDLVLMASGTPMTRWDMARDQMGATATYFFNSRPSREAMGWVYMSPSSTPAVMVPIEAAGPAGVPNVLSADQEWDIVPYLNTGLFRIQLKGTSFYMTVDSAAGGVSSGDAIVLDGQLAGIAVRKQLWNIQLLAD